MTITMNTTYTPTLTEMADFVSGARALEFHCGDRKEAYAYIQRVAVDTKYITLNKPRKGVVRAYLGAVTNYSPAQLTRLLKQYKTQGHIIPAERSQPTFRRVYTLEDIAELARIDEAHDRLSGPATTVILNREYERFGNKSCVRLKDLSPSHLYNLRGGQEYRRVGRIYTKTKPTSIPIGLRTKPDPEGRPGFIRVDSVHQGDKDGEKGVYHINLVDELTQWEVVVCVEGLSERFMIPALEASMELFPFPVLNFHADNGSEYINQFVAKLLERLVVKLTKSRPRHSGDNGLVETKNGAVIRKALGYMHIPRTATNVQLINEWCAQWFVPYLNFHRPCAFRETVVDSRGKRQHRYPKGGYTTPYEKLKSLPEAKSYLREDVSFTKLDEQAYAMSDTQWALTMQAAKEQLWRSLEI